MQVKILSIGFLVLLALLIGTTGCGDSSSGSASAITKKSFIARAEAICHQAEAEQLKASSAYINEHPGVDEEDVVIPAGLPPLEKELAELKKLGTPAGDGVEVDAYLGALEEALRQTRKNPGSALLREGNAFEGADRLAENYGFDVCANNP